jgi:hypothetical protein
MSEENLVYGSVPPNVRVHDNFHELFDPGTALNEYFSEDSLGEYEIAIMGVPSQQKFFASIEAMLDGADAPQHVYHKPEAENQLDRFDWDVGSTAITYEGEESRFADLKELNNLTDQDLVLMTWDYNVPRTNVIASEALDQNGVEDGYSLTFNEFEDTDVSRSLRQILGLNSLKGATYTLGDSKPALSTFTDSIGQFFPMSVNFDGENFDYSVERSESPRYLTVGVPWSDNPNEIDKRQSMEIFKANLPQSPKDQLKKMGRLIPGRFRF